MNCLTDEDFSHTPDCRSDYQTDNHLPWKLTKIRVANRSLQRLTTDNRLDAKHDYQCGCHLHKIRIKDSVMRAGSGSKPAISSDVCSRNTLRISDRETKKRRILLSSLQKKSKTEKYKAFGCHGRRVQEAPSRLCATSLTGW